MRKKILVIVEDYPNKDNAYPMAYVHTRNMMYLEKDKNLEINILSFRAKEDYTYESIHVYTEKSIINMDLSKFDSIVSHAPNLKNHVRFIKKNSLKNVVFFIHGHEVLQVNKYYPQPYEWSKEKKKTFRIFYDYFKLKILSNFFRNEKSFKFIFVSKWMEKEAYINLKIDKLKNSHVIHNPINNIFVEKEFKLDSDKKFDFITIRPLDGSKYCVDIVYRLAKANPQLKFKIIGKGKFFEFNNPLENITWDDNFYQPQELIKYLNESRVALMPTRLDSQGVMMCELAAFGMPIVTSNIDICLEMLKGYENAYFIDNDFPENTFSKIIENKDIFYSNTSARTPLIDKFDKNNIIQSEMSVILGEK